MIRKGGTAYDTPFAVRAAEGVFCAHKQSQKPCRARSCLHGDAAEKIKENKDGQKSTNLKS